MMTNNGGLVDEETTLLVSESASGNATQSPMTSTTSSGASASRVLTDEMEQPWPATFERSIGLLGTPTRLTTRTVDFMTKSPRPGNTPLFGARRRQHLGRGYHTPDMPSGRQILRPSYSHDDSDFPELTKVQSLDFSVRANMKAKDQKAAEAKAYRQQFLSSQKQQTKKPGRQDDATYSPGYHKEKLLKKQQEIAERKQGREATFSQCVFNMSNILMGVGMLGLPYVFKSAGWIGGFFVALVFGLITWRTSVLIGRSLNGDPRPSAYFDDSPFDTPVLPGASADARMRTPITSFPQIARESFGETGNFLLSSVLYFELFSCLAIFLVTMGDHLGTLFPDVSKEAQITIVALILTVPTALLRTPRLLSYLSMVGTFATVAVVAAVLLSALWEGDISESVAEAKGLDPAAAERTLWDASGLPVALGLIAYTFSGHAIVPSIYSSMERPQDFEKMINYTFLIVLGCCLIVAVSGYYMFGGVVDDQITISLEQSSSAYLAMKCLTWLMILTAFSKFTLTMFPLALGIEEIIAPYIPNERLMEVSASIIKLSLIACAWVVALFVPSFSFICALVGMVCTMAVSVIFPAAAYLKLFGPRLSATEKILDWILVIFGSIVAVVGTIATIK